MYELHYFREPPTVKLELETVWPDGFQFLFTPEVLAYKNIQLLTILRLPPGTKRCMGKAKSTTMAAAAVVSVSMEH